MHATALRAIETSECFVCSPAHGAPHALKQFVVICIKMVRLTYVTKDLAWHTPPIALSVAQIDQTLLDLCARVGVEKLSVQLVFEYLHQTFPRENAIVPPTFTEETQKTIEAVVSEIHRQRVLLNVQQSEALRKLAGGEVSAHSIAVALADDD